MRSTSKTGAPSPPLALLNPTDTQLCAARGGEGAAHHAPGAVLGWEQSGAAPIWGDSVPNHAAPTALQQSSRLAALPALARRAGGDREPARSHG